MTGKADSLVVPPPFDPDALLSAIVSSCDDAIISKDLNGTITSWNEGAERIFGYTRGEIVGQSILCLIPKDLHHEEAQILSKIRAGERIEHYETTRMRKNGERFRISVTISPVRDSQGRVVGASKIGRDISERFVSDQARFRLAAIVESSEDAIVSKDLRGIITSWNAGATRIFGYTAEEIVGHPILLLIPEDLQHEEEMILSKIRAGERIEHYETIRRRKSGERFDIAVTISPVRDRAGNIIGASKIARDISDRKRMERALIQTEKLAATGRMAATVAHEINNPLESVMNLIFLARTSQALPEARNYLQTAERELERVSHIARQTLGYYRGYGAMEEVLIREVLEDVLSVYQAKLSSMGIALDCRFDSHRPLKVNKGELIQIFSNIVANSIDAMPEGGRLLAEVRETENAGREGVQVILGDSGAGIAEEHLTKIFEPFFTTKASFGTGIGLWVVKQLVEKDGGTISISSSTNPESSGTRASMFFPFASVSTPQ